MGDAEEQDKSNHGWKTYLAASMAFLQAANAGFIEHDLKTSLGFLTVGIGLIGIRGALAKLIAAARNLAG